MQEKVVIGYWKMQGGAEPLIKLAKYVKIEFEVKGYADFQEWQVDKATMTNLFPNLPYMRIGDTVLSESDAIAIQIVALANREELLGRNFEELVLNSTVKGVVKDIQKELYGLFMNPNWETEQPKFLEKLGPKLQRLDKFATGKKFILGDDLVIADFLLCHILYGIGKMVNSPHFLIILTYLLL
eukprot:TRINITY_DN3223_c0_g2_i1.p1 TRINITY_DN3223_c0_g2~~TRINITY_DN3223_c0_g2_i1.p1  ORF type:complete len:184 (+),score=33.60 TRINITY_DN3223_c0_g2_i1:63-614(+)